MSTSLVFIKLGGSLITFKDQPETVRPDIIEASLMALQKVRSEQPDLRVLLGHGSGSFGHTIANRYNTMKGVLTPLDWLGFAEVARTAKALDDLVFDIGTKLGLPLRVFRPSARVLASNRHISHWDIEPIQAALENGEIPLVYGDVVIDTTLGGTILSTEDLFLHLSENLRPSKMLIAGIEAGVYADYPVNSRVVSTISRDDPLDRLSVGGSHSVDVTGGMLAKVRLLQSACQNNPGMTAHIYCGLDAENTHKIISGQVVGTQIS